MQLRPRAARFLPEETAGQQLSLGKEMASGEALKATPEEGEWDSRESKKRDKQGLIERASNPGKENKNRSW